MKNIINYDKFIKESLSEFDFQQPGLSGVSTGVAARDDVMSLDGWDRHKNNLQDQFNRLSAIMKSVFNSPEILNTNTSFKDDITNLSIIRMFKNNNLSVDVYIKFIYDGEEYYGIFKNWGTNRLLFKTEFFKHPVMYYQNNKLKFEGVIKKILEKWFKPEEDTYKTLKDITVYDNYGKTKIIESGYNIKVDEVITQDDKPTIIINFKDKLYKITGLDYYYFHWWFEPEYKPKFYI